MQYLGERNAKLRFPMKGYVAQDWMENIPLIAIDTYFER